MKLTAAAIISLSVVCLIACGDSDTEGSGGGDPGGAGGGAGLGGFGGSGATGGAGGSGGGSTAECTISEADLEGEWLYQVAGAGATPTPTGGTLTDGDYVFTAFTYWESTSHSGDGFKGKLIISASATRYAIASLTDVGNASYYGCGDIQLDAGSGELVLHPSNGGPDMVFFGHSVVPGPPEQLQLFRHPSESSYTTISVYTKSP